MARDHGPLNRVLPPALIRVVGKDIVQDQAVAILRMDRRFGKRRKKMKLRLGVVQCYSVHEEMNGRAEVFEFFVGETCDQRHSRGYMVVISRANYRHSLGQIQILIDLLLQTRRPGFNAEEDTSAARGGHEGDQLLIDAIRTGAAVPIEMFATRPYGLTKLDHSLAIDGEHI